MDFDGIDQTIVVYLVAMAGFRALAELLHGIAKAIRPRYPMAAGITDAFGSFFGKFGYGMPNLTPEKYRNNGLVPAQEPTKPKR